MTIDMKIREEREDAAINAVIKSNKRKNISDEEIIKEIMEDYDLSEEEAREYLVNFHSLS